ncbi:hypothetical protein GQ472_02715 [archaeon]|nr:hypothetical protein [archaeon]
MLTDNQIRWLIDNSVVEISHFPTEKQFQPASFDWRIGAVEIFDDNTIYKNQLEYLRLFSEGPKADESYGDFINYIDDSVGNLPRIIETLDKDKPFVLESGQKAIFYSLEQFDIPDGLFLFSELRSSNGRRGLSPVGDLVQNLSYDGRVQMSIVNKNTNPLRFYGGDRFAQLFFEPADKLSNIPCAQLLGEEGIRTLISEGLLEVSPDVVIHNDQLVFTCSDTALSFKKELGTIDTREKYEDDVLYDKINLSEVYKLKEENLLVVKLEQYLKLSNQVGILLKLSQSLNDGYLHDYKAGLNINHIFNHKVGAGWVDPGYEGQVTIHDWTHFVNLLVEGKAVMTGIVYYFPEPVGNSYGFDGLGSHYKNNGSITASV